MVKSIERRFPPGSTFRERLLALHALYAELDARLAAFAAAGLFACPRGCGVCSSTFEPDVLPVEALYAALHAGEHGVDTGALEGKPEGRCPLYRADEDAHCPIYPARPLVCRLFGFSALPDKRGELVYAPCAHMAGAGRGARPVGALGLSDAALPPDMTVYSARLSLIEPGAEAHRAPLRRALGDAACRIAFSAAYLGGEACADDDGRRAG